MHQRPFIALDGLELDTEVRDKLVHVVAVFVDEAIEHTLSLVGAVTNLVGEQDGVEYELTARMIHDERPTDERFSMEVLSGEWRAHLDHMLTEGPTAQESAAAEGAQDSTTPSRDQEQESGVSRVPISQAVPLWFEYRKWLSKYCTFRRSARPTHLT